jgi:hypothetical protein
MDTEMKLWECTYKVEREDATSFFVKDWIWASRQPTESIGHYWSHLFGHNISDQRSYIAPVGVDCTKYKLSCEPFN